MAGKPEAPPSDGQAPEWELAQKRTFTRWVNLSLAKRGMSVDDITTDLADGVSLINLVEVLSDKSVGRYDKNQAVSSGTATTRGRQQQMHALSNIEKAFKLLDEEQVKFVNIGPEDIMKCSQRLVLGMIWTLILRYHINAGKDLSGGSGDTKSARSELMDWLRSRIGPDTMYGCDLKNFKSDWADGKFLLALIDSLVPGSALEWNADGDRMARCEKAINLGEAKCKVPPVLQADDLGDDELASMTYLAYYRELFRDAPPPLSKEEAEARDANLARKAAFASKGKGSNVRLTTR